MTHAHHALVRAGALALALAAAAGLAFSAHAEPEPASVPADPSAAPVLAGPKVPDKTERLTLVQRDSAGKLVRLEDRPEAAAIPLLKLGADAKKAADKALTDHGVLVAKALSEHRALFLQIQGARQSGDMKAAAPLIREMHQKAPDLFEPSLLDKLARALPVEKAAQLRALVTEFFGALAEEMRPEGAPSRRPETRPEKSNGASGSAGQMMQGDGGEGTMMQGGPGMIGGAGGDGPMPTEPSIDPQALRRMESNLVIREMARALRTQTEMRREQTDHLLAGLNLTPEQDGKVRDLIREIGRKAKDGRPSPEERRALIEEIRKMLTPEQRKQLQENLRER